jgi:hypothetical protein|tara:strand:+ start:1405 stop:1788 length:384 start_codon:yes stop_codon:yes gene_type:complete
MSEYYKDTYDDESIYHVNHPAGEVVGHRHKKDPKRRSSEAIVEGAYHDLLKNAELLGITTWNRVQDLHFKKGSKYYVYHSHPQTSKKDEKVTSEILVNVSEFADKKEYILSGYLSDLQECIDPNFEV